MSKTQRGHEAAQLLQNEILNEAFQEIEKAIFERWRNSGDDRTGYSDREELYYQLRGLDAVKSQLTSFVTTGKLAETKSKDLHRHED